MSTLSVSRVRRFAAGAAGTAAVVSLLAACASGSSGTPAGGGSNTSQPPSATGGSTGHLTSASTSIGRVLVDAKGRTVYELVGDSPGKQTCTGACLAVWPAVTANGHQVVVNGHPAFTYVGDKSAGQTKGQNLKDRWGLWLALDPQGNPIGSQGPKSTPPSSASSSSKGAPGGGGPAF